MSSEMSVITVDVRGLQDEISKHPRKADPHYALGVALLDQGRPREAISSFRRALELMPEFTEASDALQQAEQSLSDSACVRTFKAHAMQVHDIHTIKVGDEELIASASADASVRIWSASLQNPAPQCHLKHKDQATTVAWDAENATLAVACLDDTCQLWQRTATGWKSRAVLRSKAGRFACMCFVSAEQDSSESILITGSGGGVLQKWNFRSGALIVGVQAHGGSITDIALHPAGTTVATSSGDGSCKLWDATTLACLQNLGAESGGVTSCHIALTGAAGSNTHQHAVLITTHLDPLRREARVLLWDADGSGQDGWVDGVLTAQYASIDNFHGSIKLVPVSSPWGLHAIASSAGTDLHVLDLEEGCCIFRVEEVACDILCISPDGRHVACAGKDSEHISLYQIEQESMLLEYGCTLSSKGQGVRCLAWRMDSNLLISGGQDGTCKIWQV